jgi:hypothetical protein
MDLALWLTKPTNLGMGAVLHFRRNGEPASMAQYRSTQPMLIRDDEIDNVLDIADLARASALLNTITNLARDQTCWTAAWFLIRAVTDSLWQGRYLWLWIVLEALFGADNPNETLYRLAQRIALFTASQPPEAKQRFREIKDAYTWRSKLVHGGRTRSLTAEKSKLLTSVVELAIRQGLDRILTNPELIKIFDSKGRDDYLEELVFAR